MDILREPWPWYISGPMIALVMLFLILSGKEFGVSTNLRTICSALGADKASDFFKIDLKAQRWNILFIVGTTIGGFVASSFLSESSAIPLAENSVHILNSYGFTDAGEAYVPKAFFSFEQLVENGNLIYLVLGGFLVGFGARYAGGCTSGHAISGLSNLQLPSLIAVIGFFAGGLLMVHFIFPLLFS
jgi:uncharacterized membrane protein YedE/YeeE